MRIIIGNNQYTNLIAAAYRDYSIIKQCKRKLTSFGATNSLAPGICNNDFKMQPLNICYGFKFASTCCEITLGWMPQHYDDVIMSAIASQITSLTIVYSIVYSSTDQRKHQSSASLRGPVNSPHKSQLRGECFHLMTSSWYSTFDDKLTPRI